MSLTDPYRPPALARIALPLGLAGALAACGGQEAPPSPADAGQAPEGSPAASRAHLVYPSQAWSAALEPLPEAFNGLLDGRTVDPVSESWSAPEPPFDFQRQGPLELLDLLVREGGCLVVEGTHRGWIVPADVPALLERMDSDTPCGTVMKDICSFIPTEPSTVGVEAAFLLEGLRAELEGWGYGGYPPSLSPQMLPPDRDALRAWWAARGDAGR